MLERLLHILLCVSLFSCHAENRVTGVATSVFTVKLQSEPPGFYPLLQILQTKADVQLSHEGPYPSLIVIRITCADTLASFIRTALAKCPDVIEINETAL